MSATVYTFAMGKGGSGKSTSAAELASWLAGRGSTVLVIDADEQGNVTTRMGVGRDAEVSAVAADVFAGDATPREAAIPAPSVPGADVIAGTSTLDRVAQLPEVSSILRDRLREVNNWDAIVIDTPPSLGLITLASLAAADVVIAPLLCSSEAYEQLGRLEDFVNGRVARLRPGQQVHWMLPTCYDGRRSLDREVVELLGERWPGRVTAPIRSRVAVADSYTAREPVGRYDPRCDAVADYDAAFTLITTGGPIS